VHDRQPTYFTHLENKKPLTENLQNHFFFEFLIFNLAFWRDFASKEKTLGHSAEETARRRPLGDRAAICSVFSSARKRLSEQKAQVEELDPRSNGFMAACCRR
jgi:hypothetical protein